MLTAAQPRFDYSIFDNSDTFNSFNSSDSSNSSDRRTYCEDSSVKGYEEIQATPQAKPAIAGTLMDHNTEYDGLGTELAANPTTPASCITGAWQSEARDAMPHRSPKECVREESCDPQESPTCRRRAEGARASPELNSNTAPSTLRLTIADDDSENKGQDASMTPLEYHLKFSVAADKPSLLSLSEPSRRLDDKAINDVLHFFTLVSTHTVHIDPAANPATTTDLTRQRQHVLDRGSAVDRILVPILVGKGALAHWVMACVLRHGDVDVYDPAAPAGDAVRNEVRTQVRAI